MPDDVPTAPIDPSATPAAPDTPEAAAAAAPAATPVPPEAAAVAAPAAPAVPELSPAACAARLAELFPSLFGAGAPKPLKLRIQADIQQRAPATFTRKSLSIFLHRHTTSTPYLIGLTKAATRFDLDGQPAGELAAEHREAALAELARRRAVHEARRAAENAARREADAAARRERDAEFDARRERAALLRAFETSTLTRANFCALKGLAETELEARLALARQEREQRPPRPEPRGDARGPRAPQGRPADHAPQERRPERAFKPRPAPR